MGEEKIDQPNDQDINSMLETKLNFDSRKPSEDIQPSDQNKADKKDVDPVYSHKEKKEVETKADDEPNDDVPNDKIKDFLSKRNSQKEKLAQDEKDRLAKEQQDKVIKKEEPKAEEEIPDEDIEDEKKPKKTYKELTDEDIEARIEAREKAREASKLEANKQNEEIDEEIKVISKIDASANDLKDRIKDIMVEHPTISAYAALVLAKEEARISNIKTSKTDINARSKANLRSDGKNAKDMSNSELDAAFKEKFGEYGEGLLA